MAGSAREAETALGSVARRSRDLNGWLRRLRQEARQLRHGRKRWEASAEALAAVAQAHCQQRRKMPVQYRALIHISEPTRPY